MKIFINCLFFLLSLGNALNNSIELHKTPNLLYPINYTINKTYSSIINEEHINPLCSINDCCSQNQNCRLSNICLLTKCNNTQLYKYIDTCNSKCNNENIKEICGSDGNTYNSTCSANCAFTTIISKGKCIGNCDIDSCCNQPSTSSCMNSTVCSSIRCINKSPQLCKCPSVINKIIRSDGEIFDNACKALCGASNYKLESFYSNCSNHL